MSNLPPGVSVGMIPGNRPEDIAEEAFWETLTERAPSDLLPEEWWDDGGLAALVKIARDLGYAEGYNDGSLEADLERMHREGHA